MDIIIEIGSDKDKEVIHKELCLFVDPLKELDEPLIISQIIIPENFAEKVNELENRTDFTGQHGISGSKVNVLAKNINVGGEKIILLSPILYIGGFDTMLRSFFLFHEIAHVINAKKFPEIPNESFTLNSYLGNLYYLFDEYFSDRLAYNITGSIFSEPTESWLAYNEKTVENYLLTANNIDYYEQIKAEINSFRLHGDVKIFMENIHDSMSVVSISTAHAFARYHHIEKTLQAPKIQQSKFVNANAIKLMNFYKEKFEDLDRDLFDGIEIISEYMKNFGVVFEDRPEGGYIRVLDI